MRSKIHLCASHPVRVAAPCCAGVRKRLLPRRRPLARCAARLPLQCVSCASIPPARNTATAPWAARSPREAEDVAAFRPEPAPSEKCELSWSREPERALKSCERKTRLTLRSLRNYPRFSNSYHPSVKTGAKRTGSEKVFDRSHNPSSHCRWRIATQSFIDQWGQTRLN